MSKEEQINKILNIFKNVVEQYPDYDLTTTKGNKAIYHQMIFNQLVIKEKVLSNIGDILYQILILMFLDLLIICISVNLFLVILMLLERRTI